MIHDGPMLCSRIRESSFAVQMETHLQGGAPGYCTYGCLALKGTGAASAAWVVRDEGDSIC